MRVQITCAKYDEGRRRRAAHPADEDATSPDSRSLEDVFQLASQVLSTEGGREAFAAAFPPATHASLLHAAGWCIAGADDAHDDDDADEDDEMV